MREHLKERAKRLYEFLEVVEQQQSRWFLRSNLLAEGTKDRSWQVMKMFMDRLTFDAVWLELVEADTAREVRWQDVMKQYSGRFFTIADVKLRDCLFKLMGHLAAGDAGVYAPSEVSELIMEAKGRIEVAFVEARIPYLKDEDALSDQTPKSKP